jgi:DNA-directed RNA polymerase subunit alpha
VVNTIQLNPDIGNLTIENLNLSVRSYSILYSQGYKTIGSILKLSSNELRGFPGLGDRSLNEIKMRIEDLGGTLKDE